MIAARRFLTNLFGSLALLVGVAGGANADVLYGADGSTGNLSNLYILDPATGAVVSTVGEIGFAVTGLAYDHATGTMYGSQSRAGSGASGGSLITINLATGAGTLVGLYGTPNQQTMADITIDPTTGNLYGWLEPGSDDLYLINKATGTATLVGESGLGTFGSGLAADEDGTIFFTGEGAAGSLHTIDKTTGMPTTVATLSGASRPINALDFDSSGVLYGVLGSLFGIGGTRLITINPTTGEITDLGPSVDLLDAIAFVRTTSVAEPSSLLLSGIALLGLFGFARRLRAG